MLDRHHYGEADRREISVIACAVRRTCGLGFVSVSGPAGRPLAHVVDCTHSEAVVDVALQHQHGGRVVSRHPLQLPPPPRVPLVLLVLDYKLCAV